MDNNIQDEFDRLFADDLGYTEYSGTPPGKDWEKMAARLDRADRRLPSFRWLSLMLLLAIAGVLLWKGNAMQREIADLKQQIVDIKQRDTLLTAMSTPVVVRYDTVYKTVITYQGAKGQGARSEGANKQGARSEGANKQGVRGKETILQYTEYAATSLPAQKNERASSNQVVLDENRIAIDVSQHTGGIDNPGKNIPLPGISDQITLVTQPLAADTSSHMTTATDANFQVSADTVAQVTLPDNKNTLATVDSLLEVPSLPIIKKHKQPIRLQLGASFAPLLATGTDDIDLSHSIGWGIEAQLLRGRKWGLQAGILYQQYEYEVDRRIDDRFLRHRPSPPGQDFSFKRAEGQSMMLAPSLALLRYFNVDKKWNWYLGGGYGLRLFAPADIEYEYINMNTGAATRSRKKADAFVRPFNFTASAGAQVRLLPRWAVYAETSGMFDLSAGQRAYNLASGCVGLRYLVK